MEPLYTYTDYKKYLGDQIDAHESVRGYKSQLADAAGCQRSFMSQVLNSHVHLTPDHALGLADFWKLDADSTEYYLELVHYGRAGTAPLRAHLLKRIRELAERQRDKQVRIENPSLQEIEHQSIYYSNWYWSAIHILVTVAGYQSEKAIAERLNLPIEMVRGAMDILEAMGLVRKEKANWVSTRKSLHMPPDSIYSWIHHNSWRSKANENMRNNRAGSFHFTSVYSLSREDVQKIEDMILKFLEKTNKLIAPSPEEDMACLCIDWFRV